MVFGDTADAIKFLPQMQTIQAVLDNVLHGTGGIGAKDVAFTAAKMLELRGASMNPEMFQQQADLITKAVIASGGKVTPQMLLQAQKYAGIGGTSFNNDFMYGVLPTLVQELGGSSTGTSLTSMYRALVGGRMDKRSLAVWQRLGLADTTHADIGKDTAMLNPRAIQGSDLFKSNPFRYVQEVLLPALRAHGIVSQADQSAAIDQLFSNRNAARIANILGTQGQRIMKDFDLISGAGSTSAYSQMMKHDPEMGYRALGAQWENLKTSLGITLVPILIPFLRNVTSAFNSLAGFAERHPTLTQGLMVTFAGLSLMATIGGGLMIAGAGFRLIGVALKPLSLILPSATSSIVSLGAALGPFAIAASAALAALAPIAYHREIADWIDQKAPGIGDFLYNASLSKPGANAKTGFAPPSRGGGQTIHTTVNLDGRTIAKAVNKVNMNDANRSETSGSSTDYRAITTPTGASGNW
jgi:TP901 family phage tail tape measure protein